MEAIMKFVKPIEVNEFLRIVERCKGEAWLESPSGDRFVLKSVFSRYIAMSALLAEKSEDLILYCQLPEDEQLFSEYFNKHPNVNT
jgi:hypothetical protein